MEQETSLLDIENEIYAEPASTGQRFANHIIDLIIFYIVLFAVGTMIGLGYVASNTNFDSRGSSLTGSKFVDYILIYSIYILLYTLFEGASKGRTIGKWITGTKAVTQSGADITWDDAFKRSLSRIVPFEPFSAFGGNPWHDRWTHTKVIKLRK